MALLKRGGNPERAQRRDSATAHQEREEEVTFDIPADVRTAIRDALLSRVDGEALMAQEPHEIQKQVESLIFTIVNELSIKISQVEQRALAEQLVDDMVGFGPITRLMNDPLVSDILVNDCDSIYVERLGRLHLTNARFRDADHMKTVSQKMARYSGRRVDEANPLLDARLPDGSRVNIVFPPVSLSTPIISIRRVSQGKIDLDRMIELGTLDSRMKEFFILASMGRLNIVVSGGTGSGKTTFLNALSNYIDPGERIITIEDAAELRFAQPHVVRMETRPMSLEGLTPIEQRDLLKNSLRMRPDRIILGECRGGEAFDFLQAANTGHDGSLATLHSNSPRDAISRLENMVLMSGYDLPLRVIRSQIMAAIDLIVQVERMKDGVRRVTSITEITGMEGDLVTTQEIFSYEIEGASDQHVHGTFKWSGIKPRCGDKIARYGYAQSFSRIFREIGA